MIEKCHTNGQEYSEKAPNLPNDFLSFGKQLDEANIASINVQDFQLKSNPQTEKKLSHSKTLNSNNSSNSNGRQSLSFSGSFGGKNSNDLSLKDCAPNFTKIFLGKKRKKILTTEERELEQIKKEKEELAKAKLKYLKLYQRSKFYKPIEIIPSPLTLLKPFNLSCSTATQYLKKRMTSTNYEVEKINQKIKQKLEKKCEAYGKKMKDNVFVGNNYNPASYSSFYSTCATPTPSKVKERNLPFTDRLERYCLLTKKMLEKQKKSEEQTD